MKENAVAQSFVRMRHIYGRILHAFNVNSFVYWSLEINVETNANILSPAINSWTPRIETKRENQDVRNTHIAVAQNII